jgi:hypothetical protein
VLKLSWSAALAGLPLALVASPFSSLIAIAVASSFVLAAVIAERWHRAEGQRGGVEAERSRSERVGGGRLALGETASGAVTTVPFGWRDGVRAFIPGAPGSGKTVDLALHAGAYIADGQGVVAMTPGRRGSPRRTRDRGSRARPTLASRADLMTRRARS